GPPRRAARRPRPGAGPPAAPPRGAAPLTHTAGGPAPAPAPPRPPAPAPPGRAGPARARGVAVAVVSRPGGGGATRYAADTVAERQSWTMAGICQAGDVLGLIDGDVAVIGQEVSATASAVLDRMLAAGGEMVTLVVGDDAPDTVAAHLETRVREGYLAVDTVVYSGGRQGALLLIGVE
ncbi:dihydroxyacetone kinase, partial [Streptomyces sp. NPDC059515]